jgi:tetratricopeptide (TPR) repeat protein
MVRHRKISERRHRPNRRRVIVALVLLVFVLGAAAFVLRGRSAEEEVALLSTRAVRLTTAGDFAAAIPLWRRVLQAEPGHPKALMGLIHCLLEAGRSDEAAPLIDSLLARTPDHPEALCLKARRALSVGDLPGAFAASRRALEEEPGLAKAHYLLGRAALGLGLTTTAREHLGSARDAFPDDLDLEIDFQTLRKEQGVGDDRSRRLLLKRVRATGDESPRGTLRLVRTLDLVGETDQALTRTLELLEELPGRAFLLRYAFDHLPADAEKQTERVFDRAVEAGAEGLARLLLAERLARQNLAEEALECLAGDTGMQAAALRIELLRQMGRAEEARREWEALPVHVQESPEFLVRCVLLTASEGDLDAAVSMLTGAGDRLTARPDLLWPAIDGLLAPAASARHLSALLLLLERTPEREPIAVGLKVRILLELGRVEEAETALSSAGSSLLRDPTLRRAQLELDLRWGRLDRVIAALSELPPEDAPAARLAAARLALAAGRPEAVLRLARQMDGPYADREWVRLRARAHLALGEAEAALTELALAHSAEFLILRCRILFALERTEEAEKLAGEIEAGPDLVRARGMRAWWRIVAGEADAARALLFDPELTAEVSTGALLQVATFAESARRMRLARDWLAQGAERRPGDPRLVARLALIELRSGPGRQQARKRRTSVGRMFAFHPEVPAVRLAEGFYRLLEGEEGFARARATEALKLDPVDLDARLLLALADARTGNLDAARTQLRTLLALRPGQSYVTQLLAGLDAAASLSLLGRGDRAAAAAALAPHLSEDSPPVAVLMASLKLSLAGEDLDRAVEVLRALGREEDAAVIRQGAELKAALKACDLARALVAGRELARLKPGSPIIKLQLGLLLLRTGDPEGGIAALREALAAEPEWDVSLRVLCRALVAEDRVPEARKLVEVRLADDPDDCTALALAGEVRLAAGDYVGAEAFAERAIDLGGADGIARQVLLRAALATDGAGSALARAESWIELLGEHADLLSLAGRAALAAGENDKARRYLESALEQGGDTPVVRIALAQVLLLAGDVKAARSHAAAAASLSPADPGGRALLAGLIRATEGPKEARRAWEEVLSIAPDHPLAALNLADLLGAAGEDLPRALELSKIALDAYPEVCEAQGTRGFVLLSAGQAEAAVPFLDDAVTGGAGVTTRAYLALALAAAGEAVRARDIARQVLVSEEAWELSGALRAKLGQIR